MNAPTTTTTRRDLVERGLDALDPQKAGTVAVSHSAGGVSFASAMEVMEFAKLMAVSGHAVPEHLQNNPGACLRIVFQAIEWHMSPYAVADKSYSVNKRLAYESQLIHAVVEARAPLKNRLDCKYDGEGATRTCTIIGNFLTGDTREYTTPKLGDIKVKNSPLWTVDPDQQLFYYGSRSWARKWCPDVLMGIYSREELRENPVIGREPEDVEPGLSARLAGSKPGDEGHKAGHVDSELDQLGAGGVIIDGKAEAVADATAPADAEGKSGKGRKTAATQSDAEKPQVGQNPQEQTPTNAKEYAAYASGWIAAMTDSDAIDKRWATERKLRNNCGLTADDRQPLEHMMIDRRASLDKTK